MEYRRIRVPEHGQAITLNEDFSLMVPGARHGTAPGFAGKDRVNPGSLILSAVLREAIKRPDLKKARAPQDVAHNLEQLIPGARLLGTDGFANAIVAHMDD